jgi:hypothetical protein
MMKTKLRKSTIITAKRKEDGETTLFLPEVTEGDE